MRFLAAESVEAGIVGLLREEGHDVLYISDTAPGVRDERVLRQATTERRVLLTNDKDFAMLAFLQRMTSAGIVLMRMPHARSRTKAQHLLDVVARYGTRLRAAMTVVEPHATRRRPLPRAPRPQPSK
jgi:predicted nuclease of predicted toxin-antitoxin system